MLRLSTWFIVCLWPCTIVLAAGDDPWTVLDADRDAPSTATTRQLLEAAEQKLAARDRAVGEIRSEEQLRSRQAVFRRFLDDRLGDIHPQTPLNPRVVGRIEGDGYAIERVIYESRPGLYVPGLVYLPTSGDGPFPGVIVPCGHSYEGKAFFMEQRVGMLMARHGIVALCYDGIGQGERCYMEGSPQGSRRYRPTDEHTLSGLGGWLVGQQPAADHIIDAVRSLDYLASRVEVDPQRLGCTGNSGGGNLTTYMMAVDDRVAAAAPCCWLTDYQSLLPLRGPQDAEQIITGHIAAGFDLGDYVLARLPKPVLIEAGIRDATFPIEGVRRIASESQRAAALLGERNVVGLAEADEPHGFSQSLREASVAWIKHWLDNEIATIDESADVAVRTESELWCTPHGSVLELDGARTLYELHADEDVRLRAGREAFWRDTPRAQALERVRALIGAQPAAARKRPRFLRIESIEHGNVMIHKVRIERTPDVTLPALMFVPKQGPPTSAMIYLHEDGKHAALGDPQVDRALQAGKAVLAVDLRGCGELESCGTSTVRPLDWSRNIFGPNLGDFLLGVLLDRPFVGLQVDDIAACRDVLDEFFASPVLDHVELVAVGRVGVAALHAVAIDSDRYQRVTLRRTLSSWSDVIRTRTPHDQAANTVFAALTLYDLPDLVRSLPEDMVTIEEPFRADDSAPTPRYAPFLTYEQALAGWIALFDGRTTFGFRDGVLGEGPNAATLLEGTTTTEFADYELRVKAAYAGELVIAGDRVSIQSGWNTIESRGRRGPIALEHGVVIEAMFLKPLALRPLMTGKNLVNWDRREYASLPPERRATWTFENGVVHVVGGPGAIEYAPSTGPNLFGDFVAQLVVRTRRNDTNGGFFFRNEPGKTMMGYEAQLHNRWYDAARGERGCTTGGIDDRQQARAAVALDHVPFRMTVVAHGPHLATWVNGYQTADWTDTRPADANPRKGSRIAPGTLQLQAHDPETDIDFHGVWLQELPR